MAGARSSARRQLVARGRARRRRTAGWTVDPAVARRVARWALSAGTSLVLLAVVLPWIVDVARRHDYFAVREVAVRHRGQLEPETLRMLAGVDVGMSVWDVDTEVVETRLLTNGWVRSALVRRELPDRVVLHVREHRPVAILAVEDEAPGLYYLAANGRIFAPVTPGDARDLPFVTGLERKDLAGDDAFGPRAVRRALALLRQAERHPSVGTVSELHVDRDDGLALMPTRPPIPITIGWGDYGPKLGRVAEVLPLWAGREAEIRGVSCIFDRDVVVRMRARLASKAEAGKAAAGKKTGTTTTKKKGAGRTPAVGA